MPRHSRRAASTLRARWNHLALLALSARHCLAQTEWVLDDSLRYVTRPEIEAPRWNVTVHDPANVSPGYWFVPSYRDLNQDHPNDGGWTAPAIYDHTGELVWSGAYMSQQWNVFDFRISNILGEDLMTMLYPQTSSLVVLDSNFTIQQVVKTANDKEANNMHELHIVADGTRAVFFYNKYRDMSIEDSQAVGFMDGKCSYVDDCFRELDISADWGQVFEWCTASHVPFQECNKKENSIEDRCHPPWDYTHMNSIDKFSDGGYLLSARHADTLYKISSNGTIEWRLGGEHSDFDADFEFGRQHNPRIVAENATHITLSVFDNVVDEYRVGHVEPEWTKASRGIIVVLNTAASPMSATLQTEYWHPGGDGAYTVGRGSMQVLPNGNVFIGWSNALQHSEYTADGRLVMEARVKQDWLKAYRNYKYPFRSRPHHPPDAYSELIRLVDPDSIATQIHVSWNGATEVAGWHVYKVDQSGDDRGLSPIATLPRTGFETALQFDGVASYVVAEALDRHGDVLARSNVVETVRPFELPEEVELEEQQWLEDTGSPLSPAAGGLSARGSLIAIVVGGAIVGLGVGLWVACKRGGWRWRRPKGQKYRLVSEQDDDGIDMDAQS